MSEQVILWVLGSILTILSGVVIFLANWCHRNADKVGKVADDLANFRAEVPIKYANDLDIARVEKVIGEVRQELHTFTSEMRVSLSSLAATLNQLVGANTHRG